jgi:cytochrome oxidase Cu insertion factor (SCO1/SenC/PrrC family)
MNEQSVSPSPELARKNRIKMILILSGILATVVVPTLIGDLAYRFGWYGGWETNHGQPIEPPVNFAEFQARDLSGESLDAGFAQKTWWLLYVVPADCDSACHNRLFQMRQVRKALGKEAQRVRQVLVLTGPLDKQTDELLLQEFPDFVKIRASTERVDAALQKAAEHASQAGQLYIMDPMGWIMLAYAPEPDEKASVVKAEGILQDLKKLLKASRIG